jgi:hypothetical protein
MCLSRRIALLLAFIPAAFAQQVQRADVGFDLYYYEVAADQPHIKMFFSCGRQDEYEIDVSYETLDGTAKAGVDYVATSGSFTFPAGSPTRTREIQVQLLPRAERTVDRTFFVKLRAGFPAEVSRSRGEVPVTITDLPVLHVSKASWNDEEISLNWRASATNFVLEASASITNEWSSVSGETTKTQFSPSQSLRLPLGSGNRFFRLRDPQESEAP